MTRSPTEPGIGLGHDHDKHCPRCLAELLSVRKDVDEEQDYGVDHAGKIDKLSERLNSLERQRAKSEGRDEIRDNYARFWSKFAVAMATGGIAPWVVKLIHTLGG